MDNIYIVLVHPKRAGNVGAVARVMMNFGLKHLRIVSKRDPAATFQAKKMAVHAAGLLTRSKLFGTLDEAVSDCAIAVGTTGKFYKDAPDRIGMDSLDRILAASGKNKIAFVFGPEDRGLSNEELMLCSHSLFINSSPEYPSLNLSHAAGVICYEVFRRMLTESATEPRKLATRGSMEKFYTRMKEVYLEIGFLDRINPQRIMKVLRGIYGRNDLTEREVNIMMGVFRQMEWYVNMKKKAPVDK